jgi:mannose-6-phosphate isomerase-like protein (cupin superfamily)
MIRTGDTIENPITGERVTFLATSFDTDREAVVIETVVQPHGFVAATHVHPAQSERFAVEAGTLGLKVGRKQVTLAAGEIAMVEAGTAHRFWNAGDEPVRFMCEIRPALRFEQLLETMFALAADGKTNQKGMPNLLRLAVIARAYSTSFGSRFRRLSSGAWVWRSVHPSAGSWATGRPTFATSSRSLRTHRLAMKKRVYTGAIVFAVLLLALGRLIVRPPLTLRVRGVGRLAG